jgi:hypothetical protein
MFCPQMQTTAATAAATAATAGNAGAVASYVPRHGRRRRKISIEVAAVVVVVFAAAAVVAAVRCTRATGREQAELLSEQAVIRVALCRKARKRNTRNGGTDVTTQKLIHHKLDSIIKGHKFCGAPKRYKVLREILPEKRVTITMKPVFNQAYPSAVRQVAATVLHTVRVYHRRFAAAAATATAVLMQLRAQANRGVHAPNARTSGALPASAMMSV